MLGYGRVPGLSSEKSAGSAAASGTILVPSPDELVVKLPFAGHRLLGMAALEMLDMGVIVGHAGNTTDQSLERSE
jgi:hypothetical protein